MKIKFKHIDILILLSSLLLNNHPTKAQNLVKNPSFEQYTACPTSDDTLSTRPRPLFWRSYFSGYYNSCAVNSSNSVPYNHFRNYQPSKHGDGYVGLKPIYYDQNRREYLQGEFISPLVKDSLYCVSYYLAALENQLNFVKNIDAYISKNPPPSWNTSNAVNNVLSQYRPQIRSTRFLDDSVKWMRVSGLYKAKGGEQYITIGNFKIDEDTELKYKNEPSWEYPNISYLLDMVSVEPTGTQAVDLGNDITLCPSEFPHTLHAPKGFDRYNWSDNSAADSLVIYTGGSYVVNCFMDSCGMLSDQIDIGIKEIIDLNLGADTTICKGQRLTLSAQQGFNSYLWSTGDITASISVSKAGKYSVEVIDQCGIQKDSIQVQVDTLPSDDLYIGKDTNICNKEFINVPITLNANYPLPNYTWSNGATSESITVQSGGKYWLSAEYNCGMLISNVVSIEDCVPKKDIIFIPNAFSPNNDGLNDTFEPLVNGATLVEMSIYNRWGEQLYTSTNHFSWDGICGQTACQKGLYVYIIRYRDEAGVFQERKGKFQLVM